MTTRKRHSVGRAHDNEATAARKKFITDLHKLWGRLKSQEQPKVSELRRIVDLCTTTRGNRFRFLKRPRKGPSNEESVLFERLRWHRVVPGGSGWLGSALNSTWMVDAPTFDKLDTFAMLISMAQGRQSWTDEWAKLLAPVFAGEEAL
jgi:hypothetical protein